MCLLEIRFQRDGLAEAIHRRGGIALRFAREAQVVPRFGIVGIGFYRRLEFRQR